MEKKEAIRAMLDGKKVRRIDWPIDTWLTYDEGQNWFVDEIGFRDDLNDYVIDENWEIVG